MKRSDDFMTAVSIGMPFTDQVEELAFAIKSVIAQTHKEWELILVGDGPHPAASEVARRFDDPRIRLYENPTRLGLAATLNRISGLARYPLLARMDGDDIMHPTRIARQKMEFDVDPSLDVLGSNAYLIDEQSQIVGAFNEPLLPKSSNDFLSSNAFSHPTVMGRTSWFLANPYNEELLRGQDKELWLRTWTVSRFAKLSDRLMYYRVPRAMSAAQLCRNESYNRRIILMYIRNERSRLSRAKRLGASFAKQALFSAADAKILARWLYERKWTPISAAERLDADAPLHRITDPEPGDLP